ncbi:hypothetical protein Ssi03_24070 [Sphaerisporangium siamense]|uniref:DUF4328 domain-containing protein n=1 Tax=Sphaerisporangium siamense TaxID=795645 RepID=A0A7W7GAQ8_9ACTN|nr:DUF4328 domain-containing protein [Sphaerisporangium siamense]MBB4701679.1 hypothetical protein [Sphaerisporangium siamense]GII84417.1 hypothetical protein Ssi03_24070 [Sphaerisporangium siamense]
MACVQCGYALPSDAAFCPTCHRPSDAHASVPTDARAADGTASAAPSVQGVPVPPLGRSPWEASHGPAAPARVVRPIQGLTLAVTVTLGLWCVTALFGEVVAVTRVIVIGSVLDGKDVPQGALDANDELYALSWLVGFLAQAVAGVVFVVWLFRARANAKAMSTLRHRYAKLWLVFGWILPVVSLFVPKGVVDDIWLASQGEPVTVRARRPALVRVWWMAWLCSTIVPWTLERVFFREDDLEDLRAAALVEVAATAAGLAAAVLAVLVVRRVTVFQELRRTGPAAGPRAA